MRDATDSFDPFNPETSVAVAIARERRAQYVKQRLIGWSDQASGAESARGAMVLLLMQRMFAALSPALRVSGSPAAARPARPGR